MVCGRMGASKCGRNAVEDDLAPVPPTFVCRGIACHSKYQLRYLMVAFCLYGTQGAWDLLPEAAPRSI